MLHLASTAIVAMQLNQPESQAEANRSRIDQDRRAAVHREERRVFRYEERLALCRRPEAISKALRKLKSARKRLLEVTVNGSRRNWRRST